jgi:anti-anti-sigma factor
MSRSAVHAVGLFVTSRAEPDGRVIAALRGGLDIASAPALREKLLGLLRPGASRLVVDLSAVGYADASGFAVLVGAGRRAGLLGGWLRLASPTPDVARVLSVTGLDRHLATFPTVADAITGQRPDVGTAEAGTGNAGHVAPIRPAAALPTRHAASQPSWATDVRCRWPLAGVRR